MCQLERCMNEFKPHIERKKKTKTIVAQIGFVCSGIGQKNRGKPNHMISKGKETIAVDFKSGKKSPLRDKREMVKCRSAGEMLTFNVALKAQLEEKKCELRLQGFKIGLFWFFFGPWIGFNCCLLWR